MKLIPLRSRELPSRSQYHWARRTFHALSGLLIVSLSFLFEDQRKFALLLLIGTCAELAFEWARLKFSVLQKFCLKSCGGLMRDGEERRLSGIPYYSIGCTVCFIVFPRPIAVLAVLFLAVGDPLASIAGIYFKKAKQVSERTAKKSLEGSLACFVACSGMTFLFFPWIFPPSKMSLGPALGFSLVGGAAAALAEYLPFRTDDNLSLPVVSGSLLWLYASLVGLLPGLLY